MGHQDNYVQGDKVWVQYKDGLAWHGPGEVIYQKGNIVFIHSNGDVKKVVACRAKTYELKERKEESKEGRIEKSDWNVMIEEEEKSEPDEGRENEQKEKEEEPENEKDEIEKLKDVIEA